MNHIKRDSADHERPDPDELLARIQAEETRTQRGKLKIFFGPAAGVGKTYSMLDAAHLRQAEGIDVVVGYIEPHSRPETQTLVTGLEVIPPRLIDYRGTTLHEFDLDAAVARHPALILVDELAHTNAPGARHAKRWQDVEELLQVGISVYTTLNVQHLESLSDLVRQITGIPVRETVPDSSFEQADEVELIDLAPDDLLQRLKEGKVYVPEQAEQAIRNFFRRGNLMALRELAMRHTAARVDQQMRSYRHDHAVAQTWPAAERILVSISPSPLAARLIRAAKRMADGLHAEWLAVYVETPAYLRLPEVVRNRVVQALRLAEELGGEAVTLNGHHVGEEILSYARQRNVSKIIVGKPVHPRWRDILFGSVLDHLVRHSDDIDVYVIRGDPDLPRPASTLFFRRASSWWAYGHAMLVVGSCTLLCWLTYPYFSPANLIMIYLVGVVLVAAQYGQGPSILASITSVAAFDFFFVPPYLTFAVSDTQYLVTFAVMLLVAVVISGLTVRIRHQVEAARERERRTASLYAMSREFASSRGIENLMRVAARHIGDVFDSQVMMLLPDANSRLVMQPDENGALVLNQHEQGVAQWVYDHGQAAGLGTETLPGAQGLYLPLVTSRRTAGVLGVYPRQPDRFLSPDQFHLLETFTNQATLAIERARLAEEAEQARIQVQTEQMRNALLSSVSHDLRTPLASITGAVSSLLENEATLDSGGRHELAQVAYEEADRLNRLVSNLLDMTRLEAGGVHVEKEWHILEEIVGTALTRLEKRLGDRPLTTSLPPDLPLVPLDNVLIEQVFVNLIENAIKYTPPGSPIGLSAWADSKAITVEIADRGPGLPPGDEQRIFDKFYRAAAAASVGGVGLGLTICRGIVEAHGGRIWAENRPGGGALFRFTLPLEGRPPEVDAEDD